LRHVSGSSARIGAGDGRALRWIRICSRLVVEAARHATAEYVAQRFVIVADLHYHALGLYESLGFAPREHVLRVCRRPPRG
jgi:hypothetical protein